MFDSGQKVEKVHIGLSKRPSIRQESMVAVESVWVLALRLIGTHSVEIEKKLNKISIWSLENNKVIKTWDLLGKMTILAKNLEK